MKSKLCLHGIDIKHQAQLLSLIKKALPGSSLKYKVKEKYFNDNDMYKCRIARLKSCDDLKLQVQCAWGTLLVSDRMQPVADITIIFDDRSNEAVNAAESLLRDLLRSKLQFVLEEPGYSQRIDQLRGCYTLDSQEAYDPARAQSAVYCHLPWQVYGISKLWGEIVLRGTERSLLRQLRVKLRRLRSSLALLKPLLPAEEAAYWQTVFKAYTNNLSSAREYDVTLMTCMKMNSRRAAGEPEAVPVLKQQLQQLRQQAATDASKNLCLNNLTMELAMFLLWLYSAPWKKGQRIKLEAFFRQRFIEWYDKLLALPQKYPDVRNMEQLHRIRIKLKRFRYALQSVPELPASPSLLRSLKYLQDMLGLLHDDYVNKKLLEQLQRDNPQLPELRYEIALFHGWDQAKADAALEALPEQWEEFCRLLQKWREENL